MLKEKLEKYLNEEVILSFFQMGLVEFLKKKTGYPAFDRRGNELPDFRKLASAVLSKGDFFALGYLKAEKASSFWGPFFDFLKDEGFVRPISRVQSELANLANWKELGTLESGKTLKHYKFVFSGVQKSPYYKDHEVVMSCHVFAFVEDADVSEYHLYFYQEA